MHRSVRPSAGVSDEQSAGAKRWSADAMARRSSTFTLIKGEMNAYVWTLRWFRDESASEVIEEAPSLSVGILVVSDVVLHEGVFRVSQPDPDLEPLDRRT